MRFSAQWPVASLQSYTTKGRSVASPAVSYEPTPVPSSSTLIHPWPPLPFSRYWSVK